MRLKYDQDILGLLSIVSKMTTASIKDCFQENGVYYIIIAQGDIGKAIGKKGVVIKAIKDRVKVPIRIIEFHQDVVEFIKNVVFPVKVQSIDQQDDVFVITPSDNRTRGLLIGRNGMHIKLTNMIVKRFFPVGEVKVI